MAAACAAALCLHVRAKHGRVSLVDAETFFLSASAKWQKTVAAVGVRHLVEQHGAGVQYPLVYVASRACIEFQGTAAAMVALAEAAHAKRKLPSVNLLGNFRKAHPEYAFMWATNAIVSCKPFIDIHASAVSSSWVIKWDGSLIAKVQCTPVAKVQCTPVASRTTATPAMHVEFVNTLARGKQVFQLLSASTVLYVDLEGDLTPKGRLCLFQIAGSSDPTTVFVIDTFMCPAILRDDAVKRVLTDALVVLHDARHDTTALRGQFNIELSSVFDTQVAHQLLEGNNTVMAGLNHVLSTYANVTNTMKDHVQHREGLWDQRPLPPHLIDYAAQDVLHLPAAYAAMKARMSPEVYATCLTRSKARTLGIKPATIRATLVKVSDYLREAGGYIHVSAMGGLYIKYPLFSAMVKANGPLSTFIKQHGQTVTPSIAIIDDNLTLETMTPPQVMKHLAAYLQVRGGSVAAASLADFYKAYPGVQAVMKPTKNAKAIAFVKEHGPHSTPPVYVQGTSTLVLQPPAFNTSAPEDVPVSPAQLLKDFGARFAQDKYGIAITDNAAFSTALTVDVPTTETYVVKNKATETMTLRRCFRVAASAAALKASPFTLAKFGPTALKPNESVAVACRFLSNSPGRFHVVVAFEFATPTGTVFYIGRVLEGVDCVDAAMDAETRKMIQEGTSRRQKKVMPKKKLQFDAPAYRAMPTGLPGAASFAAPLDRYLLPATWPAVDKESPLSMATYASRFQDLLFREEQELLRQQHEFDMEAATLLLKTPTLFELTVPGLAEGRPSLMAGDKVLVNRPNSTTMEGIITHVRLDGIYVAMPPAFCRTQFSTGKGKFNVRFVSSRTMLRLQHQGLKVLSPSIHGNLLFPPTSQLRAAHAESFSRSRGHASTDDRRFSRPINPEQAHAIMDIEHLVATAATRNVSLPYLLFGPPGTGKTVTVVESLVQVLRSARKTSTPVHILVCAPSNAAADNVVDRLAAEATPAQLIRMMAFSRRIKDTPASVLPFAKIAPPTADNDAGGFAERTLKELEAASVIVTTIATGAKLFNRGLKRGFFNLIVFDEAAQATEPEVVGVLGPLATAHTVVVLAGDPMQLGPVIKSTYGTTFGLGMSLMERLLPLYQQSSGGQLNTTPWSTKLVRNYRSHPDILSVPNDLFYDGDLVACAPTTTTHSLLQWPSLPNPTVPLLFHGISGGELQTKDSPSWYNPHELQLVLNYVQKLLEFRVAPADIGVITPYAKQRQKIQETLQRHGVPSGILVGSVEQFQGGERRVIIVSTVRSSAGFFKDDTKFQLGFVAHPKRFNVAVTRAKALLIVVGNPAVLDTSPDWSAFLTHCMARKACRGVLPAARQVAEAVDHDSDEEDDDDAEEMAHHRILFEQAQALRVQMAREAESQRRERERQHALWKMAQEARQAEERRRIQQLQEEQDYAFQASVLAMEEERYRRTLWQRHAELQQADEDYQRQQRKQDDSRCTIS